MLVEDYFRNVFPSWISTFSDRDRERDRRHPFAGQWSEQSRNMRTASLSLRGLAEWPECSGSLTRIAEDGKQKRAFEVRAFVWRDAGGGPLFRGFLTALEAAERRFRQGNAGEPTVCRSEKKNWVDSADAYATVEAADGSELQSSSTDEGRQSCRRRRLSRSQRAFFSCVALRVSWSMLEVAVGQVAKWPRTWCRRPMINRWGVFAV